ncbi:MAG: cation:proton antiporter subunit C [Pseudomonadota bacterium]
MVSDVTGQPLTSSPSADSAASGGADVSAHLETPDILPEGTSIYSSAADNAAKALQTDGVPEVLYSNPLPHVLILTAIVVGVATTSVGLALAVRIREAYGTVEQDQLETIDLEEESAEALT